MASPRGEAPPNAEVNVAKQRNGPTGPVEVAYDPSTFHFGTLHRESATCRRRLGNTTHQSNDGLGLVTREDDVHCWFLESPEARSEYPQDWQNEDRSANAVEDARARYGAFNRSGGGQLPRSNHDAMILALVQPDLDRSLSLQDSVDNDLCIWVARNYCHSLVSRRQKGATACDGQSKHQEKSYALSDHPWLHQHCTYLARERLRSLHAASNLGKNMHLAPAIY